MGYSVDKLSWTNMPGRISFQELGYADDLAAVTDTLAGLQKMCGDMTKHLDLCGLEMSGDKTKAMAALSEVTGIRRNPALCRL